MISISACRKEDGVIPGGSGCILAHCMGLGKTLTVIAFIATMLTNKVIHDIPDPRFAAEQKRAGVKAAAEASHAPNHNETAAKEHLSSSSSSSSLSSSSTAAADQRSSGLQSPHALSTAPLSKPLIHSVLIVAPTNTLQNWVNEFKHWLPTDLHSLVPVHSIMSDGFSTTTAAAKTAIKAAAAAKKTAAKGRVKAAAASNGTGDSEAQLEKGVYEANHAVWRSRLDLLKLWHTQGGVMVIGYEMFKNLTALREDYDAVAKVKRDTKSQSGSDKNSKRWSDIDEDDGDDDVDEDAKLDAAARRKELLAEKRNAEKAAANRDYIVEACTYLVDPGPDIVVADEAHIVKNPRNLVSRMMNSIRTKRR